MKKNCETNMKNIYEGESQRIIMEENYEVNYESKIVQNNCGKVFRKFAGLLAQGVADPRHMVLGI